MGLNHKSIFFVSKSPTFEQKTGEYIWAPLKNSSGRNVHHCDIMMGVEVGDIIIHYENKKYMLYQK